MHSQIDPSLTFALAQHRIVLCVGTAQYCSVPTRYGAVPTQSTILCCDSASSENKKFVHVLKSLRVRASINKVFVHISKIF